MPGLYNLRFSRTEWPFVKVNGGKPARCQRRARQLAGSIKWKKRACIVTKDDVEVFRFDAVTYLPAGDYVSEIDDTKIPFKCMQGLLSANREFLRVAFSSSLHSMVPLTIHRLGPSFIGTFVFLAHIGG